MYSGSKIFRTLGDRRKKKFEMVERKMEKGRSELEEPPAVAKYGILRVYLTI
jgi:hypothetical protein